MPFTKGDPNINRLGKPKGTKSFTTKVREALEKIADGKDYTYEEALVRSIMKKAIVDGDTASQKLIWNYLDGMPKEKMDMTLREVQPIYGGKSIQRYQGNEKDIPTEEEN